MKQLTVSCIGVGMRGTIYMTLMSQMKEKYKITCLCDKNPEKLSFFGEQFGVEEKMRFTDEDTFFLKPRSDLVIVSTADKDHVGHVLKALKAGYKMILVEKPFCTTLEDIRRIEEANREADATIVVCHVLRYAPAFKKVKELLDSGKMGRLMDINATERAAYQFASHGFVRGHYANKEASSPMIMAKCCHDLDLLVWYAGSKCESLSSYGDLEFFKPSNKPEGASDRCWNCKYTGTCLFDAYRIYFKDMAWAKPYASYTRPLTDEILAEELKTNQFGRCVFSCGNDVVDHQVVSMRFTNGVIATLTLTDFTPRNGRNYIFHCTKGDIELDENRGILSVMYEDSTREEIEISTLVSAASGHGGGDIGLITDLYEILTGGDHKNASLLEESVESHKMALYAEQSRLEGGKCIKMN